MAPGVEAMCRAADTAHLSVDEKFDVLLSVLKKVELVLDHFLPSTVLHVLNRMIGKL